MTLHQTALQLADRLERIARDIRESKYEPASEAVLITRDAGTGIITIHPWGDRDSVKALINEAASVYLTKVQR